MSARLLLCRASPDYRLYLRFEDGMHGKVFLGNVLDIGMFTVLRDVRLFMTARPGVSRATVVWPCGVRLDADLLYRDLEANGATRAPRPLADREFRRFMLRVLGPAERGT